jgi:isoquinoline 1-oxidoreductase subunit beta
VPEINVWVAIDPDETVTLRVAKSEMGQGIQTALPMLIAEELGCDWSKIKIKYASANRNATEGNPYHSMGTGGSNSVRRSREFLQQAGASARARLTAAAASAWGIPAADCSVSNGVVSHAGSGRSATFGSLAAAAANITLPFEPAIKTPEQFTLVGKPMARLDTGVKITGQAQYGIDVRLPDMVYAAVTMCPVFGGTLKSFDEAAVKSRRGVIAVVPVENGVAVVADRYWRAKQAVAALPVEWDLGAAAGSGSQQFAAEYRAALDGPVANAVNRQGGGGMAGAARTLEAVYEVPYLAHATMEPLNATVHWQPDRIDVWMGTQSPDGALKLAAQVGGVDSKNVHIHNCYLGGGFGRRSLNDELRQAVQVAKTVARPVKLVWTREDDIRHDRYRPQAALRFKAGLGTDGMPVALDLRTAVGSISRSTGMGKAENGIEPSAVEGLSNIPYASPALKVDCVLKNTHVPVMWWRSVGSSQNAFAVESFIDELAHAAGQDPYKYRRALLAGKDDFIRVLDALAEKSGWGTPLPQGKGRGIAIHESFGTIVGEVVEAAVSKSGEVRIERVIAAVDCGHVVNPATVAMQIESAVLYGLTAALFGQITIDKGRVVEGNFDTYQIARMADTPVIETHLVLSGGSKWGGIGEPGTPPIAPAIANALFAATGRRIRSLPLRVGALGE